MILLCDLHNCVNCKDAVCQLDSLALEDGECQEYRDITDGPDYQETYFTANVYKPEDGSEPIRYRRAKKGKRVEYAGFTLYTDKDMRYGIGGACFTEATTGFFISGEDLLNEERLALLRKRIAEEPSVMTYPWMDYIYNGPPVPHAESEQAPKE